MRDNHEQLPELLEAFKENENHFGIVAISKNDKIYKYKIGIFEKEYRVRKKIKRHKPFDSLNTTPYR